MVLAFVRDRDAPCPGCGYNLRDLSEPRCPECRKDLVLAVGLREPRFGWFLITVTPGLFSGIAAVLLSIPVTILPLIGGGPAPWHVLMTDAFGWLSGLGALVLIRCRQAFLRQPNARQRLWALGAWAVHLCVFVMFLVLAFLS